MNICVRKARRKMYQIAAAHRGIAMQLNGKGEKTEQAENFEIAHKALGKAKHMNYQRATDLQVLPQ